MPNQSTVTAATQLEVNFGTLSGLKSGQSLNGFTVVDVGKFDGKPKAITVKDSNGNIYVHFNGTGDGNWKYNAAAYGAKPQPSDIQMFE